MDNMERILRLHTRNYQIYVLLENAIIRLEDIIFETMINSPCTEAKMPTRPILTLCLQRHIIEVEIGDFQYIIKIKPIVQRLKSYASVGIDEMTDILWSELENTVKNYFCLAN